MKKLLMCALLFWAVAVAQAAPKQIIILQMQPGPSTTAVQYVFWLVPPAADPHPGFASAFTGASAAENLALVNGTTIEVAGSLQVATGTTKASIQAQLQTLYTQAQAAIVANPPVNHTIFSNCSFDGTTWSC